MNQNTMDSFTIDYPDGYCAEVSIERDDFAEAPWEWCDGHGPVSEWTTRDKRAGEWMLCADRGSKRFYDACAAQVEALRDGWDTPPYKTGTKRERAARAVKANFEHLRAWCNDKWCYVCVMVEVKRNNMEVSRDSLGMVESAGDYWRECGRDMAQELVNTDTAARLVMWRAALTEARERRYWNQRDVATV